MKIVCISDTHNQHEKLVLPPGDVLIHSGDATNRGNIIETSRFFEWFEDQPFQYKIFVAGNHDCLFEESPLARDIARNVIYLEDSGVTLEGVKFWGSPVQPEFCNWAFNRSRDGIQRHWDLIPDDTDVLITHGPPHMILDQTYMDNPGCPALLEKVLKVRPKLHIFGHIHEGYGEHFFNGTHFINAAQVDGTYRLTNAPVVVDLPTADFPRLENPPDAY